MNKKISVITLTAVAALMTTSLMARPGGGYGGGNGDCSGPGFRGGPGNGHEMHMGGMAFRHLNMMQFRLGLSDKQVEKIFNIEMKYKRIMFKNRRNGVEIKKLMEKQFKEIESVFTSDQKKLMKQFHQNRGKGKRGHGYGSGNRMPERK